MSTLKIMPPADYKPLNLFLAITADFKFTPEFAAAFDYLHSIVPIESVHWLCFPNSEQSKLDAFWQENNRPWTVTYYITSVEKDDTPHQATANTLEAMRDATDALFLYHNCSTKRAFTTYQPIIAEGSTLLDTHFCLTVCHACPTIQCPTGWPLPQNLSGQDFLIALATCFEPLDKHVCH